MVAIESVLFCCSSRTARFGNLLQRSVEIDCFLAFCLRLYVCLKRFHFRMRCCSVSFFCPSIWRCSTKNHSASVVFADDSKQCSRGSRIQIDQLCLWSASSDNVSPITFITWRTVLLHLEHIHRILNKNYQNTCNNNDKCVRFQCHRPPLINKLHSTSINGWRQSDPMRRLHLCV